MVLHARKKGYRYLAFTEHSVSDALQGGLSEEKVLQRFAELDELQKKHPDIVLLKGMEVAIHRDGSLDYSDTFLSTFDLVIVSVHSHFHLSSSAMTERIIKAVSHSHVSLLAHPTGRRIGTRAGYSFDVDAVLWACKKHNVALEINSQPSRLDMCSELARQALLKGVSLVITTDAHACSQLNTLRFGLLQARRAGATKHNVLNTLSLSELRDRLKLSLDSFQKE